MQVRVIAVFLFALLSLASLASSEIIGRTFTFPDDPIQGNSRVATDIEGDLAVAPPQKTTYCVGETITPAITMRTDWFSSSYDARLWNYATQVSQLTQSTQTSQNAKINWVTSGNINSLKANPDLEVGVFNSLVGGWQHDQFGDRSKYLNPQTGNPYQVSGSDGLFSATMGMFCNAVMRLDSSNAGYRRNLDSPYFGAAFYNPGVPLTSAESNLHFSAKLDLSECAVSGKTLINPSAQESVAIYSGGSPHTFSSNEISINVVPNFACAPMPVSNPSPTTATPNQVITWTFTLTNTLGRDVQVTGITLSSASSPGFSNFLVSTPLPASMPTGQPKVFTGTVQVPSTTGLKDLKMNIAYKTMDPNCAPPSCSMPDAQIVQINVQPGGGITCNAVSLSPNSFPPTGGDGQLSATCLQNGQPANCPSTGWSWSHTLAPQSTAVFLPSSTSPPTLTFRVNPGTPAPQSGTVTATLNGVLCSSPASVTITQGGNQPDYVVSAISVPFPYVSEQFNSRVSTKNIGGVAASSPSVTRVTFPNNPDVRQTISRGLNPGEEVTGDAPFTCPATANTYEEYAKADNDGAITESNENNNELRQNVFCSPVPNACRLQFINHPSPDFGPGENAEVQAVCTFNGATATCPALTWREDANEASLNASSTPRLPDPRTRLTVNSPVLQEQLDRKVEASSSEPSVPLTCTPAPFNVRTTGGGGGLRITACDVDKPSYLPGQSGFARAHCTDSSGAPVDCPQLAWSTPNSPNYVNLAPPLITDPAPTPVRKDFTISSNALPNPPQVINIRCNVPGDCEPGFDQCPTPLQVTIGQAVFPDLTVSLIPTSLYFEVGQTAKVEVITKNVGISTNEHSITRVKDTSLNACPPDQYSLNGYPHTDDYSCLCTDQNLGLHTIAANADDDKEITESNEFNNAATNIFYCCPAEGCFQHACFDYF